MHILSDPAYSHPQHPFVLVSTKYHAIPLSVRTRLLELLCVFNCSPYFSSCKTACDLHLCVSK